MQLDTIICQDTLQAMRDTPDNSMDLIFADPPYWMRVEGTLNRVEGTEFDGCDDEWDNQFRDLSDYENFTEAWLTECRRILKPDGSIWVIGGMQCIYTIGAIMQRLGFWLVNDVIWHKTNPTPNFMGTRLNNSHETLIWATKSIKSKFTFNYKTAKELNTDNVTIDDHLCGKRKQLGSVWRIPVCQGTERLKNAQGCKLHNTQKPEELLYRVIIISSKIDDIVFDPFGGTMTTAAVAKRTGRHYISVDNNPDYCKHGVQRIAEVMPLITDIELATYDIKPPKVPLTTLIESGYLVAGETLYLRSKEGIAVLSPEGKAVIDNETTDIHTAAAIAKKSSARRLNGFDHWFVARDKEYLSLGSIRSTYIETNMHEGDLIQCSSNARSSAGS